MAISYQEIFTSPATENGPSGGKATVTHIIHADTDDDNNEPDVRAWYEANNADTYDGLLWESYTIERMEADGWWEAVATYVSSQHKDPETPEPDDFWLWSIRGTSSGTQRRMMSLALTDEAKASETWNFTGSTKHARVLGLTKNADGGFAAEGADVPVGAIELTARGSVDVSGGNANYLVTSAGYAAQSAVNSAIWNGFAAKTLRITSFDATQRADTTVWDITYGFNFSPFFTITGVGLDKDLNVPGQYFADVAREDAVVTSKTFSVPAIVRVGVHQLFPEINYQTILLIK